MAKNFPLTKIFLERLAENMIIAKPGTIQNNCSLKNRNSSPINSIKNFNAMEQDCQICYKRAKLFQITSTFICALGSKKWIP